MQYTVDIYAEQIIIDGQVKPVAVPESVQWFHRADYVEAVGNAVSYAADGIVAPAWWEDFYKGYMEGYGKRGLWTEFTPFNPFQ